MNVLFLFVARPWVSLVLHGREKIVLRLGEEASLETKCCVHTKSRSAFLSPTSSSSKCCSRPPDEHRWDHSYLAADGQLRNAIHFASENLKGEFIACSPTRSGGWKKGWINLNNKSKEISVRLSNKQKRLNSLHNFIITNDSPSSVSLVSFQMTVCRCVFSGIRDTNWEERLLWSCAFP